MNQTSTPIAERSIVITLTACLVMFLGAHTLFCLEFWAVKPLIPLFGGSARTWLTSLFLFQTLLYLGYYLGARVLLHLPRKPASLTLAGIAVLATSTLGLQFLITPFNLPIITIVVFIVGYCGAAFLLLSTLSPTLPAWIFQRYPGSNPFPLLAAGNLGSLSALIAYPLLYEQQFTTQQQLSIWFGLLLLTALLLIFLRVHCHSTQSTSDANTKPPNDRRLRWIIRATITSMLLHSLTTLLTTDFVSVPLLWAIPLGLYLMGFILAFAPRRFRKLEAGLRLLTIMLLPIGMFLALPSLGLNRLLELPFLILHCSLGLGLFWFIHADIADDFDSENDVSYMTLDIALGGLIGGFIASLLLPELLNSALEHSLTLIPALILLLPATPSKGQMRAIYLSDGLFLSVILLTQLLSLPDLLHQLPVLLLFTMLFFWTRKSFPVTKARTGFYFIILTLLCLSQTRTDEVTLTQQRSYYGSYRVSRAPDQPLIKFQSGTTLHGCQNSEKPDQPLSYYFNGSPVDQFLKSETRPNVVCLGLGAGVLATQIKQNEFWLFIEIDPLVKEIAENPNYFSFLNDKKSQLKVEVGDGRLCLAKSKTQYDLIILDAFSSDALPTHLLTVEAFETYLGQLKQNGEILINVSNRHLNLVPLLSATAQQFNLNSWVSRVPGVSVQERRSGKSDSEWMILKAKNSPKPKLDTTKWRQLKSPGQFSPWRDEQTSIIPHLRAFNPSLHKKLFEKP